jgi:ATP-binding cassette subfamily B protein
LATIRNADKIVVVTEEGIAEEGGHDDLLKQGGIFANLHQLQFQK